MAELAVIDTDSAKRLVSHIEKIESLEDERKTVSELIKDEFAIAKSAGFDVPAMKAILKLRKRSSDDIEEEEALISTYRAALGMV